MDAFERAALDRLPLAEAVLHLWGHVTDPDRLQAIFDAHRGASYQKALSFETIVHLIADALLEHRGSGHKAMRRAAEADALNASIRAAYGKLGRMPIALSNGFLLEGTRRLAGVIAPVRAPAPESLRGFVRLAVDGKKIKHVMKRPKVARGVKGVVLGGKVAVALDLDTGLAVAMDADPDGEVSDAPLMPELLRQVRGAVAGTRLFVLDRQFCDLVQPEQLTADGDHFLIRYNAKVSFHVDAEAPSRAGRDERGRDFVEEWGRLGAATQKRRRYVRRITLSRPGDEDVILITDLLDADTYPAADLLATYLARWGIEAVFQKITEVFHLRRLISSSPEGTIFQCAFCLLLYNMIEVLRGHVSEAASVPVAEVSTANLFDDVHRQMVAWTELIGPETTAERFEVAPSAERVRGRLAELLAGRWKPRWKKAPAKKVQPPPDRVASPGGHTSVQRLRIQAKQAKIAPVGKPAKSDA